MHEILYKYLVLHKGLSVPQLGRLHVNQQSAFYVESDGWLFPPIPVFCFTHESSAASEPAVISFLAREMQVEESQAARDYARFAENLQQELANNGFFIFPNVGKLEKEGDTLHLTPVNHLQDFLPALQPGQQLHVETLAEDSLTETGAAETPPATDCISAEDREVTEHTAAMNATTGRDRWWVYAIVLFLMGALALLFYYQ